MLSLSQEALLTSHETLDVSQIVHEVALAPQIFLPLHTAPDEEIALPRVSVMSDPLRLRLQAPLSLHSSTTAGRTG